MSAENIGQYFIKQITGTTSPTVGTETAHAHGFSNTPRFYIIVETSNGIVYESKPADQTNIYIKGSVASATFRALIIGY